MQEFRGIVVSHTHWDREWYLSFQEYRMRLVRVLDKLLRIFDEEPRYKYFTLDGQVAPLEDYLEIRPEAEEKVRRLVAGGKLLIGPLYTQPDEALASSEALVRNLLIGHRLALKYGRVMKVGYFPDTFGHTAQLPQILRGFGIDNFVFMRGLGDEAERMKVEFLWEAPDGSKVVARYLYYGYCNANMLGVAGTPYRGTLWEAPDGWHTVFLDVYYEEPKPNLENALDRVKKLAYEVLPRTSTGVLLLMNGCDHMPPQIGIIDVIEYIRSRGVAKLEHGNLEMYVDELRRHVDEMEVYKGEMRGCRRQPILSGSISARMYLKQLNYRAQMLLESYAEPLSAWAMLLGSEYPHRLLLKAWKLVLQNQAHDSIYGSGIDPVHDENEARFLQAIEIASNVAYEAARVVAERGGFQAPPNAVARIFVYNPLNIVRSDVATVIADVPEEAYEVVDERGRRAPVQIVKVFEEWGRRVRLSFIAHEVPPLGYKVFYLVPVKGKSEVVVDEGTRIENEFFVVEADAERGGELRIEDKETGMRLEGVGVIVDEGDAGDEYNYSPPREGDVKVMSTLFKARIKRIRGPVFSKLLIEYVLEIPARLEGQRRSSEKAGIPVVVEVTLYRGVRRVDIRVELENRAEDHRLRVRIPTGLKVDRSYADSHFYVIERKIEPPKGEGWVEQPPTTHPQLFWVCVTDGVRGVTVANRGLPEYEVRDENGAVIYLTLLRAVGWLSRGDLQTRRGHAGPPIPTPKAQCKRHFTFEYSLILHEKGWLESKSYIEARAFALPFLTMQLEARDGERSSHSVISVKPVELVVTALKKAEDSGWLVLRFYNISGEKVEGEVTLGFKAREVWLANLNEEPLERLEVEEGSIRVSVAPHKIVTLMLSPLPG